MGAPDAGAAAADSLEALKLKVGVNVLAGRSLETQLPGMPGAGMKCTCGDVAVRAGREIACVQQNVAAPSPHTFIRTHFVPTYAAPPATQAMAKIAGICSDSPEVHSVLLTMISGLDEAGVVGEQGVDGCGWVGVDRASPPTCPFSA
eukprot:352485-Chlamydomonas_euryale.AAC.4